MKIASQKHSKPMEDALRKSEQKFRLAFENAKDAILWADPKTGIIINCNKAAEVLLEKKRKEIIGFSQTIVHPPQKSEYYQKMFKRHIKQKYQVDEEAEVITKSGKIKHVHISASVTLIGGEPIIQGIFHDITERKQMEEALRQSEEMYKVLVNTFPDAVTVTDLKGRITYVSGRTLELHGFKSAEELLGRNALELISSDDREKAVTNMQKALKEGCVRNLKYTLLRQDGTSFIGELNAALIRDVSGKPKKFIATTRDITEREQMERTLKESEAKLLEQKSALEQKNIALSEIIKQVEVEKTKLKDDIAINATELLFPIVTKLKKKKVMHKYVNLLQYHLEELTSSFGRKITEKSLELTPREIEICSMVKGGLTSKEISELLTISHQTVEKHRRNIRHKVGISNKHINLTSFLHSV